MNRERHDEIKDHQLVTWQAELAGRQTLTERELNDCQRKPIMDRIKELNISAGYDTTFNLNRKASSHDSLTQRYIDQTPDIIKDIPKSIKCASPDTDESSKESSRHPSPSNTHPRQNDFQQRILTSNPHFSLNLSQQSSKRTRPLASKQIDSTFLRNQIKSQSFRVRPSVSRSVQKRFSFAGRMDPLRTTADSIYSSRGFPFSSTSTTPASKVGTSPQFGLTQSTKLLQQYQKKKTVHSNQYQSSSSVSTSLISTPRKKSRVRRKTFSSDEEENQKHVEEEESKENAVKREKSKRQSKRSGNVPLRSQSFRRETEAERKANLSFETAISSSFRSQSHQDLNPESEKPLWKTPSIEHIDRIRRLNNSEDHLKSAILGTRAAPKAVLRQPKSPLQCGRRAPRPSALFGLTGHGSDPGILSFSSNDEDDFIRFKSKANFESNTDETDQVSGEPPSYHQVIKSRNELVRDKKFIQPSAQSSPSNEYFQRNHNHRPRVRSRDTMHRIPMPKPEAAPISGSESSTPGNTPRKKQDEVPVDDTLSTSSTPLASRTLPNKDSTVKLRKKKVVREHRNSYISAVSAPKNERFYASLDSIVDIGDGALSNTSGSPLSLNRAGSMDSVLMVPSNDKGGKRRPDSIDRVPRPRASYIEATDKARGRTVEKTQMNLRRRPSLNKQLRKKLESMMTSSKVHFDDSTIERIRSLSKSEPLNQSRFTIKIKNRVSWTDYHVTLYPDYLYIWKDEEIQTTQVHLIAQTNANYAQNDLSGLILEVKLSDCLCDVDYSSRKKNVFKVTTTEKNDIYFACKSTEELKLWSSQISEISQSNLNVKLIKQLTEKSKFNKKRPSVSSAQKSPNISGTSRLRTKNRPTFGVKLELCSLQDDIPIVVIICCTVIEERLEQDGTGIYRRNGNKPIVDQLEEEMNKHIDSITVDHDLMKDVKNVASVLKSFFRKLPDPLFTDEKYDDFIQTSLIKDESQKMKKIRNLLIGLPQHHYSTAKYFMCHLSRVARSENTRMDSKNLATVIAPNLIRSTTGTLINDVKDLNNQCSLIDALISQYEWFFEKSADDICEPQPTSIATDKPTDLTKLFHSALHSSTGLTMLNQSIDDSKKSFFSGFKWNGSNTMQTSKENVSEHSLPAARTDPMFRAESPQKVHKSRKDRLEINPSSRKKAPSPKKEARPTLSCDVISTPTVECQSLTESTLKRRHTVTTPNGENAQKVEDVYEK